MPNPESLLLKGMDGVAHPCIVHKLHLFSQRDRVRALIDLHRHAGEGCLRGTGEHSGRPGGVEGGAVAGADQVVAGRIEVHQATGVGAGRVVSNELAVAEMNQDSWIAVRGQGKAERAIRRHVADLRDHAASSGIATSGCAARHRRTQRDRYVSTICCCVGARQKVQNIGKPDQR